MQWNVSRVIRKKAHHYSMRLPKPFSIQCRAAYFSWLSTFVLTGSVLVIMSLLTACHQVKYSDTESIGIRKVERGGLGGKSKIYFQMYDKELGKYYEAEQGEDGTWYFTKDGNFLRDLNRNQVDGS